MQLRCQSLHATGGNARTVARSLLSALDKAAPPSLLLWLADSAQPDHIAAELAAAAPVVVGGVSHAGLIGGGTRCPEYEGEGQAERAVALAVTLPAGATATAWHSLPTGLPDLPAATWEAFATARPADSPHLLLIAAPPLDAAFPIESFLATLDRLLPWANKVGGLLAGSSSLYVGQHAEGVTDDTSPTGGATARWPGFGFGLGLACSVAGRASGAALQPPPQLWAGAAQRARRATALVERAGRRGEARWRRGGRRVTRRRYAYYGYTYMHMHMRICMHMRMYYGDTYYGDTYYGDTYYGDAHHGDPYADVTLQGVALDAVVCQGATPVGPSFTITEAQGEPACSPVHPACSLLQPGCDPACPRNLRARARRAACRAASGAG